jgi:two-component system chemotaxis sensor kinase CheA
MIDLSLLQDFIPEAMEHLEEMESNLIRLESEPGNRQILDNIFRSAHTIKGSSEYMGMKRIAGLAHKMESLLDVLRNAGLSANRDIIDVLIASRDRIVIIVGELEENRDELSDISDLVARMEAILAGGPLSGSSAIIGDTGAKAHEDEKIADEPVARVISDLKSSLYEAASLGISETGKQRIFDSLGKLLAMDDIRASKNLVRTLKGMKKLVTSMAYADDAGDVLASLHELVARPEMAQLMEEDDFRGTYAEKIDGEGADDSQDDLSSDLMAVFDDETGNSASGEQDDFDEINEATDRLFDDEPDLTEDDDESAILDASEESGGGVDFRTGLGNSSASEIYEEEYDEELFGIFMDHLKENFEKLDHQISLSVNAPDQKEIIHSCVEMVKGLQSSASYMDYKELDTLYGELKDALEKASKSIDRGQTVSLMFVRLYMKQIATRFPKYEKSLLEIIESGADSLVVPDLNKKTVTAETYSTAKAAEDIFPEAIPEITTAEDSADETQGLFDDLDNVFDNHAGGAVEQADVEPFEDDIEDMLASIGAPSKPAEKVSGPATGAKQAAAVKASVKKEVQAAEPLAKPEIGPKPVPETIPEIKPEIPPDVLAPMETETLPPLEDSDGPGDSDYQETVTTPVKKDESGSVHYDYTGEKIAKQSLRVDTRKIDSLMNQVGELVVSRASYSQLSVEMRDLEHLLKGLPGIESKDLKRVRNLSFRIGEATVALGRVANDLQEGVMKVRMLPIAQLFNRYPRLIRDLVQGTDKKVRLEMKGEETELDKMVIEQIADPMIHIIRNSVDHGIETAGERLEKGKPEEASLMLESYHESNHVVVEITDDGRGIRPELIKKMALQKQFATADELERMNTREIISIIMRPGFSTVSEVTKTSGRGVGMDVVKKNIEKLNGTIEIDSEVDKGTRVRIKIPLTMAIIQALLVRVGHEIFTIPLSAVEETIRINENAISIIDGVEVIHLRNTTLSLLRLTEIFGSKSTTQDLNRPYVVVVNTGMKRVGLVVDMLIGQEETVIKPLADYLQESSGFSGATILGDGRISLILDIYELVNLTINKRNKKRESFDHLGSSTGPGDTGRDDAPVLIQ